MLTLGVDLAAQPENSAAVELIWQDRHVEVKAWHSPLSDQQIRELIPQANRVGIDIPLGWPTGFVRALVRHQSRKGWPLIEMSRFRLRATDRFVEERLGMHPLSVSTDRIAIPAARAASILSNLGKVDRAGSGKIVEVYPASALRIWGFNSHGYKGRKGAEIRRNMIRSWTQQTETWGKWTEEALTAAQNNDNVFDALIAAIIARCAAIGRVERIPQSMKRRASIEGWIALPTRDSLGKLFPVPIS